MPDEFEPRQTKPEPVYGQCTNCGSVEVKGPRPRCNRG